MPEQQFATFVVGAKSPFPFKAGIYLIRNNQTGKIYIGSAVYLNGRMRHHGRRLELGLHRNGHLQHAWNKDGPRAFSFDALLYCAREDLIFFEQRAIDGFIQKIGREALYNLSLVAGSTMGRIDPPEVRLKRANSRRGKLHSEETKRMFSETRKGMKASPEARANMSAFQKGRPKSEEHKSKIGAALRGKKRPPETVAKMSAALKGRPGHPNSPETREKLRVANTGKRHSPESKAKMSAARQGKKFPNMMSKRGITLSMEHRAKISAGNKAAWLLRRQSQSVGQQDLTKKQSSKIGQGQLFL